MRRETWLAGPPLPPTPLASASLLLPLAPALPQLLPPHVPAPLRPPLLREPARPPRLPPAELAPPPLRLPQELDRLPLPPPLGPVRRPRLCEVVSHRRVAAWHPVPAISSSVCKDENKITNLLKPRVRKRRRTPALNDVNHQARPQQPGAHERDADTHLGQGG
jgi:hypothetical protein